MTNNMTDAPHRPRRKASEVVPWLEPHQWKPGQSGNPGGRPPGILDRDEVKAQLGKFWQMSATEVEAIAQDPKATAGQRMLASIVLKGIKTGDFTGADWLLNRTIGKVKEELEVSTPKPFIWRRRDGETVVLGAAKQDELHPGVDAPEVPPK